MAAEQQSPIAAIMLQRRFSATYRRGHAALPAHLIITAADGRVVNIWGNGPRAEEGHVLCALTLPDRFAVKLTLVRPDEQAHDNSKPWSPLRRFRDLPCCEFGHSPARSRAHAHDLAGHEARHAVVRAVANSERRTDAAGTREWDRN